MTLMIAFAVGGAMVEAHMAALVDPATVAAGGALVVSMDGHAGGGDDLVAEFSNQDLRSPFHETPPPPSHQRP